MVPHTLNSRTSEVDAEGSYIYMCTHIHEQTKGVLNTDKWFHPEESW